MHNISLLKVYMLIAYIYTYIYINCKMMTLIVLATTFIPLYNYCFFFWWWEHLGSLWVIFRNLNNVVIYCLLLNPQVFVNSSRMLWSLSPPGPYILANISLLCSSKFATSTCKWYHTVFVILWLVSRSIMPSRFIQMVTYSRIFLFLIVQ